MLTRFLNKHEKGVHRALEIMPGLMTWIFITSPVWLGLLYPEAVIYLVSFLTILWSYLAVKGTIGLVIGYPRYKKELATDWWQECLDLEYASLPQKETLPPNLESLQHIILVPAVNESEIVLKQPLESFLNQTFPAERVTLVYTIEEKYAEQTEAAIRKILGERINNFKKVLFYAHPAGIPGEAIGAGAANRTWGAKHAVEQLTKDGENLRNYIFTTFDADHVPHKKYLARLTHLYLTTERRDNRFYATAVHLYDNNLWRVPAMMRIEANFVTLGTLASRAVPWGTGLMTKDTFAAYSTSLQTLIDAGYWDVSIGVDDTIFYWKAFFARHGDFKAAIHYIPYAADAVEADTYWGCYKSLYKQLLRWGWGVVEVPFSVKRMLADEKISTSTKLAWLLDHFKTRVLLQNTVFLLTFGFWILTLVNTDVKQSSFAYSLPDTMSIVLTATLIFLIPQAIYRSKIIAPMPKEWPIWRKALTYTESILLIVNLLTFSFIPWIDAQTRMMLGKKMKDLYHTPKVRN